MNTLRDVREANQMWEQKFQNAGRERIVLSSGKRGALRGMLGRIGHTAAAKSAASRGSGGVPARKQRATTS